MSEQPDIWRCPDCGEFLDISSFSFLAEVRCPNCGRSAVVHTQLANFRLDGVLGLGGMSVVLRATDLILNRPLAIKVLNETYRDRPERIARFENECAMMARVRHENVVSVYSAGWARNQFYIAMELVNGSDLESIVLRDKPLDTARALEITHEIVLGLQAAHKAGMLHRDMKPGNVIIDASGKAKVLDFGLSLDTKTEDIEEVIWATPFYVPPETLLRQPEDVRTDIYALGMTLRFLLTGKHELPGDNGSLDDLLNAKRRLPSFAQQAPHIDPRVTKLVDRMTAFKPENRPASYTGLLKDLEEVRAVQQEMDEAKDPRQIRKRKLFIKAVAAVSLILGLAGAAGTAYLSLPEPQQDLLECDAEPSLGDLSRLDVVEKALKSGNWPEAEAGLKELSGSSGTEPALGAMASLLLAYHAVMTQADGADETYLSRFKAYMAREEEASSAAATLLAQLKGVASCLEDSSVSDVPQKVSRHELRAITYVLLAKHFAGQGDANQASAACRKAQDEIKSVPDHMGRLGEWMESFQDKLLAGMGVNSGTSSASSSSSGKDRVLSSLAAHDFDAASALLQEQLDGGASGAQRTKAEALLEISQVGKAVVDVLKKRKPGQYRAGLSADKMKEAASGIDTPAWEEEVYTLGLLLSGKYSEAFQANPYRNDTSSTHPFAILMRGWQAALQAGE